MLTLTLESPGPSFHQAFQQAMDRGELARTILPQQVGVWGAEGSAGLRWRSRVTGILCE